jgi:hypothetical protein
LSATQKTAVQNGQWPLPAIRCGSVGTAQHMQGRPLAFAILQQRFCFYEDTFAPAFLIV